MHPFGQSGPPPAERAGRAEPSGFDPPSGPPSEAEPLAESLPPGPWEGYDLAILDAILDT